MLKFSLIVPVFNRPDEVDELLKSLTEQTARNFEVIVVEDGSSVPCEQVIRKYETLLQISYFFKPNSGPGPSRNYGAERAHGDYFIFLDSDCVIPPEYITSLNNAMEAGAIPCFGGPDSAHPSFTKIQKAISYSMTSFLTTGGIRGGKRKIIRFHPRSFNMGFSREVFQATGGFAPIRFGEDIDLSLRIEEAGYMPVLIPEAFVYHKRRTDFRKFFKQIYNSGIARINLYKRHPTSLKLTHFFPAFFLIGLVSSMIFWAFFGFSFFIICYLAYLLLIFMDASLKYRNIYIGILSVCSTIVQMVAYGTGFLKAFVLRVIFNSNEFQAFEKNFYK